MYQQTYCHTLSKPFSKIFFFRIYVPTTHSADVDFDETSVPVSTHLRANPAPANQSTNDTVQHTPQPYTRHEFRAHTAPHTPYSLHKHPQPHRHTPQTPTQTPTRRRPPPTLTTHREAMPYLDVDADAAFAIGQARHRTGQVQDQTGSDQTRIRPRSGHWHRIRRDQTGRSPQIFPPNLTAD